MENKVLVMVNYIMSTGHYSVNKVHRSSLRPKVKVTLDSNKLQPQLGGARKVSPSLCKVCKGFRKVGKGFRKVGNGGKASVTVYA